MRLFTVLPRYRKRLLLGAGFLFGLWLIVVIYHTHKSLPTGVSVAGPVRRADVEFVHDLTYRHDGEQMVEQAIFDRVLAMIDSADQFVVLDMFLFNDEHAGDRPYRPLTTELTDRLIARKLAAPDVAITFITDPINNFYGAYTMTQIRRLREYGIDVVETRLKRLRDSNPLFSAGWRIVAQWFGTGGPGVLPHPLSSTGQRVTARAYLTMLNFKANHRKLIVTEDGCLVTSANPHDASSVHSNIAFAMRGPICQDVLDSERGVAAFSRHTIPALRVQGPAGDSGPAVQFVTEGEIRAVLLEEIGRSRDGDAIDVAVFYLSDRRVVTALLAAAERGVAMRVILDPNKDAFGRQKGGVPNRQVAFELRAASNRRIDVRWYDTHGEQFHTKLAIFRRADSLTVIGGSANYTRRNLGDYNLEADVRVTTSLDARFAYAVTDYFARIWNNLNGEYTLDFEAYRDDRFTKRVLYRIQEFTGLCTF